MKPKTTFFLFVIAVALFSYIWFFEQHGADSRTEHERNRNVFRFKRADVTRVEIKNAAHPDRSLSLEKRGEAWHLTAPVAARANDDAVRATLDAFEILERTRTFTEKEQKEGKLDDAATGLDAPQVEVLLTVGDKPLRFRCGRETSIGRGLYLQAETDAELLQSNRPSDIFVVSKDFLRHLEKPVAEFRDRTVADFSALALSRFELRAADPLVAGGRKLALAKTDGKWRLSHPINARADGKKIEDLIQKIASLRREDFIADAPPDLKPFGLDEPVAEITAITSETEGAKIISFGAAVKDAPEKIYAKRKEENSVFTVSASILDALKMQPNDLREKLLASFPRDDVNVIELQSEGQTTRLRRDNGWRIAMPEAVAADEESVTRALARLETVAAADFVADVSTDLAQYGLDKPELRITLLKEPPVDQKPDEAKSAPVTLADLLIGKRNPEKEQTYAKRADEPFIYAIATPDADALPQSALDLRTRAVLTVDRAHIQSLTITRAEKTLTLKKTGEQWAFPDPALPVNTDVLTNLLVRLSALQADQWIALSTTDLTQYGLDKPELSITLEVQPPAPSATHTLLISGKTADHLHYAKLQAQPQIFLLNPLDYEQFTRNPVATPPAPAVEKKEEPPPAEKKEPAPSEAK